MVDESICRYLKRKPTKHFGTLAKVRHELMYLISGLPWLCAVAQDMAKSECSHIVCKSIYERLSEKKQHWHAGRSLVRADTPKVSTFQVGKSLRTDRSGVSAVYYTHCINVMISNAVLLLVNRFMVEYLKNNTGINDMWPFFQENSLCIALSRINTLVVQPG
jgi:hypothetical protein